MPRLLSTLLVLLLAPAIARADDLKIVSSGGFAAALKELVPAFEKQTGNKVEILLGPSMGNTPDTVPARLARNEPIDAVVMVGAALQKLVMEHKVEAKIDVANSPMGAAVKAGTPHPDVSTADALRTTLLHAKSVAVSDSASGTWIMSQGFAKLGITEQMQGRAHTIPATPVGEIIADGKAELGFQQVAELKPVHGIELLGPLPEVFRLVTLYSAGVVTTSAHKAAADDLVRFLASPANADTIKRTGLEPIPAKEG